MDLIDDFTIPETNSFYYIFIYDDSQSECYNSCNYLKSILIKNNIKFLIFSNSLNDYKHFITDFEDIIKKDLLNQNKYVIHYIGHASNSETELPEIILSNCAKSLKFDKFLNAYYDKNVNFKLILDCCNSSTDYDKLKSKRLQKDDIGLRNLFNLDGKYILLSSRKGYYSKFRVKGYTIYSFFLYELFVSDLKTIEDMDSFLSNKVEEFNIKNGVKMCCGIYDYENKCYLNTFQKKNEISEENTIKNSIGLLFKTLNENIEELNKNKLDENDIKLNNLGIIKN